jgi:hypothetical protein
VTAGAATSGVTGRRSDGFGAFVDRWIAGARYTVTASHYNAVMARRKKVEKKVAEIDRSAIRYLLALTPEERIRLAAADARNLHRFDLEVEKSKGR